MTGYTDEAENLIVDSCLKSICIVKVVGLQDKQTRSVNFTKNISCMGMHAGIPHIADWCQQGHPMSFHQERQPKSKGATGTTKWFLAQNPMHLCST
jgi:hypothetical protein